jgi:asparagine synthase (glutamine-hydrolysing)
MGQAMRHRGPDDEGYRQDTTITLGMRRLSIIDLTGGHQPIANEDGSVWTVCNGEIYNFQALRRELEECGHRFSCASDTEVIVHLYEQHGLNFVNRLEGMFALAVWDANRRRLVLARDRVGEKPLYIFRDGKVLLFASEIKSILECEGVPRRANPASLHDFCALGYVPAPLTMFEGIEKLPPGEMLVLEQSQITIKPYWDLSFSAAARHSEEEWIALVRQKLLNCVRKQLVSDVPLGAFLSGGIDSSVIVAAMAQVTDRPVNTYSIGFEGPDQFYDELPFARLVAKTFSTNHHEILVRPEVCDLLPQLIWHMDEPVADSALITTYLVARLASESVTVILSGVGGDELFGGYRRYLGEGIGNYYRRLPGFLKNKTIPFLFSRLPQDRHSPLGNYSRLANSYVRSAALDTAQGYMNFITVFSADMRAEMFKDRIAPSGFPLERYFARSRHWGNLHQHMYVDMKTSLPDDLLLITDKMTMAASIECRAPLLDCEMLDLAASMPARLKVSGLTLKYALKKAAADWLPPEILHRKKRGFGAPVGSWFRSRIQGLVADCLSPEQIRKRGFFEAAVVERMIASHRERKADCTDQLLALVVLELWCRTFLDNGRGAATPKRDGVSVIQR